MNEQESINYQRIATAIDYIRAHFRQQPGLEEIAEKVHLSPFHFQRLFTEWAGTSPKKFLQYTSLEYAKRRLKQKEGATLFEAAHASGLSGTGRLHDLFIRLEGMTPAEYKHGGSALSIQYGFFQSPFGQLLIANTKKGICYMAFEQDAGEALKGLQEKFPAALLQEQNNSMQEAAISIFQRDWSHLPEIKLHLKASSFQLKVWEALLKIPLGQLSTYGAIARQIAQPQASRAVGSAIGSNPVAFLIPCHRVIQASGAIGGYRWESTRKMAMIGWEGALTENM